MNKAHKKQLPAKPLGGFSMSIYSITLFTCSNCGKHNLAEVQSNVTLVSVIDKIGKEVTYSRSEASDGEVVRYQCVDCGEVLMEDGLPIGPGQTAKDLFVYLVKGAVETWNVAECQDFLVNELDCNIEELDNMDNEEPTQWYRKEILRRLEDIE